MVLVLVIVIVPSSPVLVDVVVCVIRLAVIVLVIDAVSDAEASVAVPMVSGRSVSFVIMALSSVAFRHSGPCVVSLPWVKTTAAH